MDNEDSIANAAADASLPIPPLPKGIMSVDKFLSIIPESENHFTALVNMFVSHNYPALRNLYLHIPNESNSPKLSILLRMQAMGVLPGAPDFLFMKSLSKHNTYILDSWFIELKMLKGVLSKAQKILHPKWIEAGVCLFVCNTPMSVMIVLIRKLGLPLYPPKNIHS